MEKSVDGSWRGPELTGGCPKHSTWPKNPQYALVPSVPGTAIVELSQNQPPDALLPIGLIVLKGEVGVPLSSTLSTSMVVTKSKFKPTNAQRVTFQCDPLPPGKCYVILPSTFEPGFEGDFKLGVGHEGGDFTLEPHITVKSTGVPAPTQALAPIANGSAAAPSVRAAAAAVALSVNDDPVLAAGVAQLAAQKREGKSAYEDLDFNCAGKDPKCLYVSGAPGAKTKKIDAWARLEVLPGSGELCGPYGKPGALIVPRDGLEDRHILGALAMVRARPELLKRVLVWSQPGSGMHGVRLFKDGGWRTVVVDDLLPCHGKRSLAYSSNAEPREGPVAIVLKALAKLYGCYEAMSNGRVGASLEDLTGGFSDKIYLRDGAFMGEKQQHVSAAADIASGAMWAKLSGLVGAGHLLGATFKAKHAAAGEKAALPDSQYRPLVYPVTEMKDAQGTLMVRLRNCYGRSSADGRVTPLVEWEGAWGNSSMEWQNMPGPASALGGRPKDGSFWMTFDDFIAGFTKVYVCRVIDDSQKAQLPGEWVATTAGGCVSTWPGTRWRSNPQYRLTVPAKTSALIALAQPDAELDGNLEDDSYPHAIGVYLLKAGEGARRKRHLKDDELLGLSRLAKSRQVCFEVELEPGVEYTLLPCTLEPSVMMSYYLTVCSPVGCSLTPLPTSGDWQERTIAGKWSVAEGTAGGCPNNPASWSQNPQCEVSVNGPATVVGVLSLALPPHESARLQEAQARLAAEAQEAAAEGRAADAHALQEQASSLAPALGFLAFRSGGGMVAGVYEERSADLVGSSKFAIGTQEVSAEITLSAAGTYTFLACTFHPGYEGGFDLTLYCTDQAFNVKPLNGGEVAQGGVGGGNRARPQGIAGPGADAKKALAPPAAKHNVSQTREELGDTGKIGYAQKMELEELARLEKWVENVPMMTIEGQPLSDNVKKRKKELVEQALANAAARGGLFEDPDFPPAAGSAAGDHQPAVYSRGAPVAGMPVVTQWRRPREWCAAPKLFKNDWEVENVVQGFGIDNKWLLSAINIVSGNREQLDRFFFGEAELHADKGFFVCKIYRDDPLSDDDWQVIIVDDRIPCTADGNPAFARNVDPAVYWVMIMEKVFAKYSGSYEAMQGGTVVQGLEDLTGGIGYKFDLTKDNPEKGGVKQWVPKGHTPGRLWDEIMEKMKTEHVVGCTCTTKGEPRPQTTAKGILLNRAYCVVTGGDFEDNKLMRLRIPLDENGDAKEWNGKWSDDSSAWSSRLRQMLHFSKSTNDGTFWIEYEDFCKHMTKVYMCRMLDDLWTRFTVKSRWMDETAGGCTNFMSWRNNNQWILNITRPKTKLVIKLTQPDARMSAGHGRHYSNAIGFYIFKGNQNPTDFKRRKLVLKDGDEEDGGDFVFCKEPRFSRQVTVEYTFEKSSPTPYILMPFMFEPGRESLFRLSILSDDRDDDGIPDFGFSEIKPEEDWQRTTLLDAWSRGGDGNALGGEESAGGPLTGPLEQWTKNFQFQITLEQRTRCFLFLELRDVKTDMRDVAGLQTEPDYPTVGFVLCQGEGDHIKLDGPNLPKVIKTAELRRGDGQWLELGELDPDDGKRYIVIPYTDQPGVEHKFALTLYTDLDHKFEKLNPRLCTVDCVQCGNPSGLYRVMAKLETLEEKYVTMMRKEQQLKGRGGMPARGGVAEMTPAQRAFLAADTDKDGTVDRAEYAAYQNGFAAADTDGDGMISQAELAAYANQVQAHAQEQHKAYVAALEQANREAAALRSQIERLGATPERAPTVGSREAEGKTKACAIM